MMDELKPCPFCGTTDQVSLVHLDDADLPYTVECSKCGIVGGFDLGTSGAIEVWNTRPIEDALRAELASVNEANRWVAVGERLPEFGVRVDILRTCPDGYDYQVGCLNSIGSVYWWSEILACKLKYVTHWRPLLAPPE